MKKLLIAITIASTFVACKSKTDKPTTDKELILLQQNANGSYLTDTGVANREVNKAADVAERPNAVPAKTGNAKSSNNSGNNSSTASTGSNSNSGSNSNTSTAAEKKGISKAAKGAIIGGVGGAVTGAVIGKNAKGAVIGGAVGATGGYIIGRSQDKKDGRVKN